ncbi:hypothetical protein HN924_03795 [Candidatus Woesearchaeota archaeon]|jgi:hypothetical protein|nr:hypothetical protein [Candidatus Woesearchaeota archaeon]MBT7402234.1 hypothetical protein [Candidatus Woesearchaeota archaeon]
MALQQINIRLSANLIEAARNYAEHFGFKNVQELTTEALREKVMEKSEFDETFTKKEIELIEKLAEISIKNNLLGTEEELREILKS